MCSTFRHSTRHRRSERIQTLVQVTKANPRITALTHRQAPPRIRLGLKGRSRATGAPSSSQTVTSTNNSLLALHLHQSRNPTMTAVDSQTVAYVPSLISELRVIRCSPSFYPVFVFSSSSLDTADPVFCDTKVRMSFPPLCGPEKSFLRNPPSDKGHK